VPFLTTASGGTSPSAVIGMALLAGLFLISTPLSLSQAGSSSLSLLIFGESITPAPSIKLYQRHAVYRI
ncbi:MAG: hypothetical protein HY760_03675, partial [Nitrospirae bacterium]|nr:hypothetical protein [Nitrospirota bacterium]